MGRELTITQGFPFLQFTSDLTIMHDMYVNLLLSICLQVKPILQTFSLQKLLFTLNLGLKEKSKLNLTFTFSFNLLDTYIPDRMCHRK